MAKLAVSAWTATKDVGHIRPLRLHAIMCAENGFGPLSKPTFAHKPA